MNTRYYRKNRARYDLDWRLRFRDPWNAASGRPTCNKKKMAHGLGPANKIQDKMKSEEKKGLGVRNQ
jgi:hypothetical protein